MRVLALACCFTQVRSHAQTALSLPEITITSFRGDLRTRTDGDTRTPVLPMTPGTPVRILPGTTVFTGYYGHALITLPGAGALMVGPKTSIRIPTAAEVDRTLEFNCQENVYKGRNCKLFMNLSAPDIARQGGANFVLKTSQLMLASKGGRFFVNDAQQFSVPGAADIPCCTIGVHEGSVSVLEPVKKQTSELKADAAVLIKPGEIGAPRVMTKAEASYDIGSKLAALGKDVPARLPPSMRPTRPTPPNSTINSLGMALVPVPGTRVLMCIHETRQQDYAAYEAANPAKSGNQKHAQAFWGWEDHPVSASWDEAQAFCAWLSQKEGKKYRLPTDGEWSHAVGIGSQEKRKQDTHPKDLSGKIRNLFPWGSSWPPPEGAGNLPDISGITEWPGTWPHDIKRYDDGFTGTAPVMSFKPNSLGIYDLGGNAAEWCEDWHDDSRQQRVLRNCAFWHRLNGDDFMLSSYRDSDRPDSGSDGNGFRIVLEQP